MGMKRGFRMASKERDYVQHLFGRHISRGQVRYLRCAHLDVYERERRGATFVDALSGKKFFDCFSSAGCFNVGRGNEKVRQALDFALDRHDMGTPGLLSGHKVNLAVRLAEICPGDLKRIVLCASGADACACALKLAKGATGRNDVITMNKAYHGHEGFSLSANGKDYYKELFVPLMPGFHVVDFNDLEQVRRVASRDIAAIVLEPVQGEGGIHVAGKEYMSGLRRICDEHGIMLVFDEVQTGFGRTGRMWAMEHYDVIPDIMFTAKSISGGLFPNGAVVYRDSAPLRDYVEANPLFHFSHSGGTDLGCIVSAAVLDYIIENRLWEHAFEMGERFKDGLVKIWRENEDCVREVRGLGLMIGIEYEYEFIGALMAECLARQGVWAVYSGNAPQVMRFQVPLTVSSDEIDELLARIRKAVKMMRYYLVPLLPLARIPPVRALLDNVHLQILAFNLVRDLEDAVVELMSRMGGK
jgi:acetylornithine/succinyldiaminopimelate/putrescine aminotransferase